MVGKRRGWHQRKLGKLPRSYFFCITVKPSDVRRIGWEILKIHNVEVMSFREKIRNNKNFEYDSGEPLLIMI